jgi:hypothetical protein
MLHIIKKYNKMSDKLYIEKYSFYDKKCYDCCDDNLILDIYYLDNCNYHKHECIDFSKCNSNYNYFSTVLDDIKYIKCLKFNRYVTLRLYYYDGKCYEDIYDCEFIDVGYGLCKMIIKQNIDKYYYNNNTNNLYIKSRYNCGYHDCDKYVYSGITNIISNNYY